MNRAVLIMPYFGKLPPYFGFYLKSVEGKCFDVLLVTNLEVGAHPSNVKLMSMSFDAVVRLASQKLGIEAKMENPKRLCNFRPMYGKIFEDYIGDYEYWGFGDCDLVYGALMNSALGEAISTKPDVVSFRKWWTSGPTCFVRNIEKNNRLYERARNWRKVVMMTEPDNPLFFDEVGGCFHFELMDGKITIAECALIRDSFCAVVSRSTDVNYYHKDVLFEENIKGSYVRMMRDGRLFAGEREIPCFHFIGAKFRRFFTYRNVPFGKVSDYWIDDTGFYISPMSWRFRFLINPWRKVKAIFESLRENGLQHWIGRVFR